MNRVDEIKREVALLEKELRELENACECPRHSLSAWHGAFYKKCLLCSKSTRIDKAEFKIIAESL